ncbi:bacteriophage holin [Clostridium puniceum]|uniref:Bacteriophage holin n=1 Tax=Clostridium puniceum TaxID=29367 RepID=A0A1S8SXN9_9CLOT|nr:phage holin [Clostridium puniceum]OOM70290.1 bacteriophage holin [Clostridium puniceum]
MLTLDLKTRFKNKTFILSMLGAIVLLIQQLGFKDLIPSNWSDIVNTVLSILVMLGIVIDTSTPGVSDKVIQDVTIQAINKATEIKEEVKTEATTTAINNTVTENSYVAPTDNLNASAKINVDVPVE